MVSEQQLERVAASYEDEGYQVIRRPKPEDLPPFAKDFTVELLCRRGRRGVLVTVKKNHGEFADDDNLPHYAEVIEGQPEWRYDFHILEGQSALARELRGAVEPTDEQLESLLARAEGLRSSGAKEAAFVLLWAALEAAMRRHPDGAAGDRTREPRGLLSELYAAGRLNWEEIDRLGEVLKTRTQIVHGFVVSPVEESVIEMMIEVTRRLMEESRTMRVAVA